MPDQTQKLAERIASIIEESKDDVSDLASLRSSVEKINQRLDDIEGKLTVKNPVKIEPSSSIVHFSNHPNQERFAVIEALADDIIGHLQNEKACAFEPNGKPCDHCAMCSSRGF